MLNAKFPSIEKTIKFLKELDSYSLYSTYYITKALLLCGEKPNQSPRKSQVSFSNLTKYLDFKDAFLETPSELATTFMTLEIADLFGFKLKTNEVQKILLQFKKGKKSRLQFVYTPPRFCRW